MVVSLSNSVSTVTSSPVASSVSAEVVNQPTNCLPAGALGAGSSVILPSFAFNAVVERVPSPALSVIVYTITYCA